MRQLRRRGLKLAPGHQAGLTLLTTKERARAALPAANLSADDAELDRQIATYSRQVLDYLRVPATLDGRVTLGVERLHEKIHVVRSVETIYLSRAPINFDALGVAKIHNVVIDDEVRLPTEIEVLNADGLIKIVDDDDCHEAFYGDVIIEYTAGYALPYQDPPPADAPQLPAPIEDAMFALLKGGASAARRDPSIRSEASEEVDSYTYFAEGGMAVAWREAKSYLDPFRRLLT